MVLMPASRTRTCSGNRCFASRRATSTPKASSPKKMLPRPATRTHPARLSVIIGAALGTQWNDFRRRKIKEPPERTAQVGAWIVIDGNRHICAIVQVAEHRRDGGTPPVEEHVHGIGAPVWGEPYARSSCQADRPYL